MRESYAAFADNLRTRELRLAQLSFGLGWASEWAFTVALSVVAYDAGGARAVGLVALVRLAPSAIVGPFAATLADRFRRDLILAWIGIVRAIAIGASALLLAHTSSRLHVYALALIATTALTPFRAAHSALLPTLCRTPKELTTAMAVRGLLDSLSILLGPLVAAALLAESHPAVTFAVVAGASLCSAILILRVRHQVPPRSAVAPSRGLWHQAIEGVAAMVSNRDLGIACGMGGVQGFTRGCLTVFSVVVAIKTLKLGDSGVGLLNGAVGVGAVLGSLAASMLVGSRRLGGWFSLGIAWWGLPLMLIAVFPSTAPSLALLACIGAANSLLDVALFTLIGRMVEDHVLARVNGVLESLVSVAVGLGSLVTPFVISGLGIRGALAVLGSLCPAAAILGWGRLRILDRTLAVRTEEIDVLRSVPMLHVLPAVMIEKLARAVRHETVAAAEDAVVQGTAGHTFYVIEAGEAEVLVDGRLLSVLRAGGYFGEIALLRDVPRTATVRARTQLRVCALSREAFIPLVTGHEPSMLEADTAIEERLATFSG
jgi:MFS family permease